MFQNDMEKQNPYQSKVDVEALNRRRRRFLIRCTIHHICQEQWRQYARKCACVYDIRNVKN